MKRPFRQTSVSINRKTRTNEATNEATYETAGGTL